MTLVTAIDGIVQIEFLHERVDAAAAPELKKMLDEAMAGAPNKVVLDLGNVKFMDSTGLGLLVSLIKQIGPDGAIAVANAQPAVARLFELTRLGKLFGLVADVPAARALVSG